MARRAGDGGRTHRGRRRAVATTLAGTPLGTAGFGPGRGSAGIGPLPFAAGAALLLALAVAGALVASRTVVRRAVA